MQSKAIQFEELVQDILRSNGFVIVHNEPREREFDFQAILGDFKYAVEAKHYRTVRAVAPLISSAAIKLLQSASKSKFEKAMLVVSCYIQPELRLELEKKSGIVFC